MFEVGDVVRCIKTISGGPHEGDMFTVTSVDTSNIFNYIGFPLPHLNRNHYSNDIITGREANWGMKNFILIHRRVGPLIEYEDIV